MVSRALRSLLRVRVIDLNKSPPTLEYFLADPPLYAPTGSVYRDGLIYHGCSGGNSTSELFAHPGLYAFDPKTNKSASLLNSYFGYYFNSADDITIHSNGDIWFTNENYAWFHKTDDTNPQLMSATYRYRPSTGVAQVVNTQLNQPNGIGFSPDKSLLYITDTGAGNGLINNSFDDIQLIDTPTGPRIVYQFDVINEGTQIVNGRPMYLSQDGAPDSFKVARNGYLVTATGHGVDVLNADGVLLVRIQTVFPTTLLSRGRTCRSCGL